MSEWRCRAVPAGIANTAFGLLQRDKKTSIFAGSSVFARAALRHLACAIPAQTLGTARADHRTMLMPRLFGLRRSPDKIGLSTTAAILSSTQTERSASCACAWQIAFDHARDAPASLCKKVRLNACARHRARSNLTRIERIAASDSLVREASSAPRR